MSKIERYAGNLRAFASEAQGLERTLFGETAQADDLTSQVTAAFLRGWGVVGPSEHPSLEDFNAAMYAMSQFIAYQHQMGVPEWDSAQEYYIGSLCVRAGETYSSLENGNVGNAPPSAKWTPVLTTKNGLTNLSLGTAAKKDVGTGVGQVPDMSAFASLSGDAVTPGYTYLPNGILFQWGTIAASANDVSTTFPVLFPNGIITIMAVSAYTPGTGTSGVSAIGTSINTALRGSFTSRNTSPTLGGRYLAIGR